MNVIAHMGSDGRTQPLHEHLLNVSRLTGTLAEKLNLKLAGELIGLLHDLGKNSPEFQKYISSFRSDSDIEPQDELRGTIDHSTAGAQVAVQQIVACAGEGLPRELAHLLALCIVSHHSGLIDSLSPLGEDTLQRRLNKSKQVTHLPNAWESIHPTIRSRAQDLLHSPKLLAELRAKFGGVLHGPCTGEPGERSVQFGQLLRLLFSCLIDADRTDTARFEHANSNRVRLGCSDHPWQVLQQRFEKALGTLSKDGVVNAVRQRISDECSKAAACPTGIYTLTVPTGGGKTLAALRWALEHACQRSPELPVDHIFFVSPYISIVEQNAAVVREILEPAGEPYASVVLEHHSNLIEETGRERWRRKVLTENWDVPVVFTTMVQLLESLFGAGTRSVRRLHTMARSIIVFDEVQTLPVKLVHLFNNSINLLSRECGTTVLLCTATQPILHRVNPRYGAAQLAPKAELIGNIAEVFQALRRYTVLDETARAGGWTHRDVANLTAQEALLHGSCLTIVNTKRDARELFLLCREDPALQHAGALVLHLSTGMCPAHRTAVLKTLREHLAQARALPSKPVVCISTQLIEAGVDIDFAAVVRDLAGLDSMAQAAGRCNRHGKRPQGQVYLVRLAGELPTDLVDINKGRTAAERVLGEWRKSHPQQAFPLDSPEQMAMYFDLYFFDRRSEMVYKLSAQQVGRDTSMLQLLGSNEASLQEAFDSGTPPNRKLLHQSFSTAAKCFAVIGATQGVIVPFGKAGNEVQENICASFDLAAEWQLLRQAQPFTISLHLDAFRRVQQSNVVYESSKGSGVYCLRAEYYDGEYGLRESAGIMEAQIV